MTPETKKPPEEDTVSDNKKDTSPLTEDDKGVNCPSMTEQEACAKPDGPGPLTAGEGTSEAMAFDKLGENDVVSSLLRWYALLMPFASRDLKQNRSSSALFSSLALRTR